MSSGNRKKKSHVEMANIVHGHGLTAQRFAGKPLRQPKYALRDVPRCHRNLSGSRLFEVSKRDDFNDAMAEMVLLCNEVMRRQADRQTELAKKEGRTEPVKRTAKPLSLEYIADRMDVDDPLWGFFVRTADLDSVMAADAAAKALAASAAAAAAGSASSTPNIPTGAPNVPTGVPLIANGGTGGYFQPVTATAAAAKPSASPVSAASDASPLPSSRKRTASPRQQAADEQQQQQLQKHSRRAASAAAAAAIASSSSSASAKPAAASASAASASAFASSSTAPSPSPSSPIKEGMLQGFITVTTFTNWQKSFRWDSMHESAFAYDPPNLAEAMKNGQRVYDRDGSLAQEMQATVRCGDAWNEGIVWPRIAEISLLGALGCGRSLLELVIERLERLPASTKRNYDYVVLQATTNSVPFYESMGFVRVGCITDNENFKPDNGNDGSGSGGSGSGIESDGEEKKEADPVAEAGSTSDPIDGTEDGKPSAEEAGAAAAKKAATEPQIVSSPVSTYTTTKDNERVGEIAKSLGIDVWDIIFLNHFTFPNMAPSSKVKKGTEIFIPNESSAKADACSNALRNISDFQGGSDATQWYYCIDDETPKDIAEKFQVDPKELTKRNRDRLPGIMPFSNLIEGTKVQVSHFDRHMDARVPYCHWTFPDDTLETSEPSYMMALKLNRKKRAEAKYRPVEYSFAVPVSKYDNAVLQLAEPMSAPASSAASSVVSVKPKKNKKRKRMAKHPDEPEKPKRPLTGYFFFLNDFRDEVTKELGTNMIKEVSRVIGSRWNSLSDDEKAVYQEKADEAKVEYEAAMKKYEADMKKFRKAHPEWVAEQERLAAEYEAMDDTSSATSSKSKGVRNLFNKVVKLTEDGRREAGTEFEYFYVLTYIPDLQWCHLAPMRKVGKWGKEKPKAEGRAKWMLVHENEGKEVDISAASIGDIVKAKAMKNNPDADKEQWDIPESGPPAPGEEGKPVAKVRETYISMESLSSSISAVSATSGKSSKSSKKKPRGPGTYHWSPEEIGKYNEALEMYGKDYKKIAEHVETRTIEQCRSHSQKFRERTGGAHQGSLCKADGCYKYRQAACEGYCIAHFKSPPSAEKPAAKPRAKAGSKRAAESDPEPAVQRPAKKVKDECKVPGCPKSRKGGCKGMCKNHFDEWPEGFGVGTRCIPVPSPPATPPRKKTKTAPKYVSPKKVATPPSKLRVVNGKTRAICLVPGCEKHQQPKRDGMCCAHFTRAKEEGLTPKDMALEGSADTEEDESEDIEEVEGEEYTAKEWRARQESLAAGATEEMLDLAEELGFPIGWSVKANKNANYIIYTTGKKERFSSKAAAYEYAGLDIPNFYADRSVEEESEEEEEEEEEAEEEEEVEEEEEEDPEDPPWRRNGHKFIGRTVKIPREDGSERFGTVVGWISEVDVDKHGNPGFISEYTGEPARLFNVAYLDGDVQDFEERELENKFVRQTKASQAAASSAGLASATTPQPTAAAVPREMSPSSWTVAQISAFADNRPSPRMAKRKGVMTRFCDVPNCEKICKNRAFAFMCRLHFREANERNCTAWDIVVPPPGGDATAAASGANGNSNGAAAAASALGSPGSDTKKPKELEGVAEDDYEAIMKALEPPKATRSGKTFTSPLVGQL